MDWSPYDLSFSGDSQGDQNKRTKRLQDPIFQSTVFDQMKTNLRRSDRGGLHTDKTTMARRPKAEAYATTHLTAAITTEDPSQIQKDDTCVLMMQDLMTQIDSASPRGLSLPDQLAALRNKSSWTPA